MIDTVKPLDGLKKKEQSNRVSIFRNLLYIFNFPYACIFPFFAFISSSYMSFWEGELLIHETLLMTTKRLSSTV